MADKIALSDVARVRMLAWIEALESDEYTQARKALALSDSPEGPFRYCCLGVLCEVAIANDLPDLFHSVVRAVNEEGGAYMKSYGVQQIYTSAPPEVVKWLFDAGDNVIQAAAVNQFINQNQLIDFNDDQRADFHQIAAYLRDTYNLDG